MIYLGKKQNEMLAKHKISLPDNLSHRIPIGWIPLISRTFDKLFDAGWDGRIFQIKEKLGSLRISIPQNKINLLRIVWAAEEESMTICDICSASGTIVDKKGILAARCEAHENVGDDYRALDEENYMGYDDDVRERIEQARKMNQLEINKAFADFVRFNSDLHKNHDVIEFLGMKGHLIKSSDGGEFCLMKIERDDTGMAVSNKCLAYVNFHDTHG